MLTAYSFRYLSVDNAASCFQGRSFLHPPHDIPGVSLTTEEPPERCFLPKRLIHEWSNAHARGVAAIRLFPKSGHLLLSAGMDSKIKVHL